MQLEILYIEKHLNLWNIYFYIIHRKMVINKFLIKNLKLLSSSLFHNLEYVSVFIPTAQSNV